MKDRETVIEALQYMISGDCTETQFDYTDDIEAAIALLKEHEPTTFKPHYIDKYGKHFICGVECGSCHKEISSTYHYCPYCGRSVKLG